MKKFVLIAMAFAFVGCKDFTGQLTVNQPFEATYAGFFGKVHKLTVTPGSYETVLSGTMGGDLNMSFKLDGKKQKIKLNIPKNTLPDNNGTFQLSSEQLEQPFAIRGELATDITRDETRRSVESCTKYRTVERCYYSKKERRTICNTSTETYYGQQEVEFHNVTTVKTVFAEVVNPSFPSQAAANINGRNIETVRVYDYKGICY